MHNIRYMQVLYNKKLIYLDKVSGISKIYTSFEVPHTPEKSGICDKAG